jgi:hypothetical protein
MLGKNQVSIFKKTKQLQRIFDFVLRLFTKECMPNIVLSVYTVWSRFVEPYKSKSRTSEKSKLESVLRSLQY